MHHLIIDFMKSKLFVFVILLYALTTAQGQTVITVLANQADELLAKAGSNEEIASGESATLGEDPSATGGTPPYRYTWNDGSTNISTEANPSVSPTKTTSYTLLVRDDATCSVSDEITISVEGTGINDFTMDELKIYPIPATDNFTVDYRGENGAISLLDEQGRHLWTRPLNGKTQFTAPHASGIYLLRINAGNKESIRRIIVSK